MRYKAFVNKMSCSSIGLDANICPEGHYCPLGTANPEPCPKGTYSNGTGLQSVDECVDCPAGEFCAEVGLIETNGPCQEG